MNGQENIVYCNCSHADVVPTDVKREVLRSLSASGVAFDALADLCAMSARRDPTLKRVTDRGHVRIAACFPRAVKWLFAAGGAPLPEDGTEILNMRSQSARDVVSRLLPEQTPRPEHRV
jgi:hypothetical protein